MPPKGVGSSCHHDEEHEPALRTNQRPPRDCRGTGAFLNPASCPGGATGAADGDGANHDNAFDDRAGTRRTGHVHDGEQLARPGTGEHGPDELNHAANRPSQRARGCPEGYRCAQGRDPNGNDAHRCCSAGARCVMRMTAT